MELKSGYKQTEAGVIPSDWDVKPLKDVFTLKNGYAFSSDYFSEQGLIVITPGNFKLTGGLIFNERNTLRYSGEYSSIMKFTKGDLLIVMTDLTPDCNLLGKPGFVNSDEPILHNQRIGKIIPINKSLSLNYLYWYFLSEMFSRRMKSTATGSTVRHTSNGSIYNSSLPFPPLNEQNAIATALSDTDQYITHLEKLIGKKRNIKQGAMQELLKPKEGWVMKRLGEIGIVIRGASPRPQGDTRFYGGTMPRLMVEDVTRDGKFVTPKVDFLTEEGAKRSRPCKAGTLTIVCSGTVGIPSILAVDACIHDGFLALVKIKREYSSDYLYHQLIVLREKFEQSATHGGVFTNLTTSILKEFEITFPSENEQIRIATILSDMDAEITTLETKLSKAQNIKQGMMQQLLTGKIRLIKHT